MGLRNRLVVHPLHLTTRTRPRCAAPRSLPKNRTRNGEPLNFRGALIQFRDSLVPVQLLDDVVLDESVPAMDLDRVVHGPVRGLAREQLRRARLVRVLNAAVLHPRGSVCEDPRGLDFRRHVRELPLDRLELRDLLAERLPLLRVLQALLEGPLRDPEGLRRNPDPPAVEGRERNVEPLPLLP